MFERVKREIDPSPSALELELLQVCCAAVLLLLCRQDDPHAAVRCGMTNQRDACSGLARKRGCLERCVPKKTALIAARVILLGSCVARDCFFRRAATIWMGRGGWRQALVRRRGASAMHSGCVVCWCVVIRVILSSVNRLCRLLKMATHSVHRQATPAGRGCVVASGGCPLLLEGSAVHQG